MKWIFRILGALAFLAVAAGAALYFIPAVQDRVVAYMIDEAIAIQRDDLMQEDALRVAICGSGSPMPDPDRAPACNLVIAGGRMFVIDAGPGSWSRAAGWRLPLGKVEAVFLTHFHSDHIGDIGEVNLQSWVGQRQHPLRVYGGPGVERVVNGFNEAFAMDASHRIAHHGAEFLKPELGVMEAEIVAGPDGAPFTGTAGGVVYDRDGVRVTAFAVDHDPIFPAYGYRVEYKGRSVVFSGDTVKSESLASHAKGADVLIHEAMLMDVVGKMESAAKAAHRDSFEQILHDIPDYHASPRDAADVAGEAGVKHLVLSHVIPPIPYWLGERMFLRDTDAPGVTAHLAYDGMLITLPADGGAVRFDDLGP